MIQKEVRVFIIVEIKAYLIKLNPKIESITTKLIYIARYYSNLKRIIRLNGYCRIKLFKRGGGGGYSVRDYCRYKKLFSGFLCISNEILKAAFKRLKT